MANESKPTQDGIPEAEQVHELMKSYGEVNIKVQRRNDRGHLAIVHGSQKIKTELLSDIDSWLQAESGGGDYFVLVRPPGDPSTTLMKFSCRVEGSPLPPKLRTGAPVTAGGQFNAPLAPPTSGWAAGVLDETARAHYLNPPAPATPPAPGATMASDQLLFQELESAKIRAQKLEEMLERERQERIARERDAERNLEKMRLDAQEQKHASEMKLITERMEAQAAETRNTLQLMRETRVEPKPFNIEAMATAVAAVAPVLVAFIQSSKESANKSLEVQQQGMNALLNATLDQTRRPDSTMEMIKSMGPLLMPLITNMIDQKSPATQAALFNTVAESQLNSVAMMAQLIESFAGGEKDEPWWLPMMRETLAGAVKVGESMMEAQQAQQQQQQQQVQQRPMPAFQVPDNGMSGVTFPGEQQQAPAPQQPAPQPAAKKSKLSEGGIMSMMPEEFRTPEWSKLIKLIHDEDADAKDVGEFLAEHIAHCIRFEILPEPLANIAAAPAETLDGILKVLPIYRQSRARANTIVASTIATLDELEVLERPDGVIDVQSEPEGESEAAQ